MTTLLLRRCTLLVLTAAVVAACRGRAPIETAVLPPPTLPGPSVSSRWLATQATILELVTENRPAAADSALLHFARAFARTPEGDRARWWRTLMRAEARSSNGDAALALAQIDSFLADSSALEVRTEAVLMRRSINAIDSARKVEVRRRIQATQLATDRGDELKVSRDSMVKLGAEIDRLKRRLRAP